MGKLKEKLKISDEWWHLSSKMELLWDTYYKKSSLPLMILTNTFLKLYSRGMIFILIIILSLILIEYSITQ